MKTRSQEVATYAYECVVEVLRESEKVQGKYRSYVTKLPAMVVANGLVMTVAFVCGKVKGGEDQSDESRAYGKLLRHLVRWVFRGDGSVEGALRSDEELKRKVIEKVSSCDIGRYRIYTMKALEVAEWLKRVAEALIKKEEES
jgi:CRISPR-associated protein Cmr5